MEVPLKVILPKSELIVILDRSVFDALKESSFVDHFVPQLITIEKCTPFPILPKINNRPAVVTDTLYLIVAVLSFIVILTSISLILVLLFNLQSCNFESKITCRISDKTNGPILSSFYSTYSTSYSIRPPHSIF